MSTTTTATTTPILLSATPTLGAGGTMIDLVFDTAMAAGSGTITITDGAVQTVIDRATGQPTMRVVGATDTHTISASSVSVDGAHVTLNVAGLLPGHQYSIVMGGGVLLSSGLVPFGGVRSTSQLQFTAPSNADHEGPSFVSASADATLLKADGSLKVTLTFSEVVSGLTADALHAPNATVSALTASGDGHTWIATLVPSGPVEQAGNALTIDMSKVHDTVGNAGTGVNNVASYAVDTRPPTGAAIAFDGTLLKAGAGVGVTFTFSEAVKGFTAAAINAPHAAIGNLASIDDGHTWTATLSATDPNTSSGNQLSIDMGQLQDLNGNAGSGSFVSSASYAVDTVGPEAPAIALQGGLVSRNDSVTVTFTFKEQVSLDAGAVSAPNATVQELHSTDGGTTWVAMLRPDAPVEASANTLAIDMSKVHDAAGNAGAGSVPAADAYAVDSKGPSAAITLDGTDLRYGASITATITLSDAVGEAALRAALSHPNADIQALASADGGKTWTATLVSSGNAVSATNALGLDLTQLQDAHGNAGAASVQSSNYTADNAVGAHIVSNIAIVDDGADGGDYLTSEADQTFSFTLSGSPGYGNHIELSIDGHAVSADSLHSEGNVYWYQDDTATHFADGVHTFSARVVDNAGHASAAVTQQFTIDTVKPTLAPWPEGGYTLGAPDALELKLSEAVYMPFAGSTSILFTDDDGGAGVEVALDPSFLSADGKTLTIRADQHHLQAGKHYHFTLPEGLRDLAGNNVVATPLSIHIVSDDLQAPSASAATAQIGKGLYGIGTQIEIAVAFDEAVKVAGSGQPALALSNGGVAAFHALSADQQTMYFTYTVGAGNEGDSGNLQLDGGAGLAGHVSDLAGNMLDLAHIGFSSLANLSAAGYGGPIQIDAHAPQAPGAPVLAAASDTGTVGDGLTNLNTPSLSGSGAEKFATVKLFEGDTLLASTTSDANGSWTMTNDAWSYGQHLGDGAHTLVVRQVDGANNQSAVSGALALSVDTAAPNKPGAP
ncbi:MAG: Ig-like domain-containing protein, partial [Telluria sp.]